MDGIIRNHRGVIHFLYKDYFPLIQDLIENHAGNLQDAEDIFQDGMVLLYLQIRDRKLVLRCALRTYFFAICQNLWRQRLERKYRLVYVGSSVMNECGEQYLGKDYIAQEQELARQRLFWKYFNQLPEDCRKILQMYIDRIPFREVTQSLRLTDENYAKVRKYLCKKLLINRIRKDPDFPNCTDYEKP